MQKEFYPEYSEDYEDDYEQERPLVVLKPAQAMDILDVGKNTMYRLLNTGKIKGFRIGRSWRITLEALEDFIN